MVHICSNLCYTFEMNYMLRRFRYNLVRILRCPQHLTCVILSNERQSLHCSAMFGVCVTLMVWIAYMQNAKGICFRVHAQVQFILIVYAMLPSHDTLSFRCVRSNATLPMIIAFHLKALVFVLEIQFVYHFRPCRIQLPFVICIASCVYVCGSLECYCGSCML